MEPASCGSQPTSDYRIPSGADGGSNPIADDVGPSSEQQQQHREQQVSSPREPLVPPYWHLQHTRGGSHVSQDGRPPPIQLEDHTEEHSEQCRALWAKHVTIDDYTVVTGSAPGVGDYVVWNCVVETLDVSSIMSFLHDVSTHIQGIESDKRSSHRAVQ